MTAQSPLNFASVQASLGGENFQAHASEIHGLLTGLICSGFSYDDEGYIAIINDFFNNAEGLSNGLKNIARDVYADIWQSVLDESFTFQLLIPDDDEAILERGTGLSLWVQGFNLGFGLQQKQQSAYSEDVAEIVKDFTEIANLSDELEEDEETEGALFEITEYVRISALLCFTELGAKLNQPTENKTIH